MAHQHTKSQQSADRTITLVGNVVTVLTSDPGSPVEGQIWYNTTSHVLKFYNGSVVKTVTAS